MTSSAPNEPVPAHVEPWTIRVSSRSSGSRTTVLVAGEVDLASVGELRSEITAALDAGAAALCIDLSAVQFIDSSGLHLLVETWHEARRLGRRLAIVCPPGQVRRVFEIAQLADMLPLYDDAAAASGAQ